MNEDKKELLDIILDNGERHCSNWGDYEDMQILNEVDYCMWRDVYVNDNAFGKNDYNTKCYFCDGFEKKCPEYYRSIDLKYKK